MLKVTHTIEDIIMNDENKKLINNILERVKAISPKLLKVNHVLDGSNLEVEININAVDMKLSTTGEILFMLGNIFGMAQVQLQSESIKLK